ncbi:MAG: hypothetical protein V5B32_12545 [Candidatus Accumulibacter sp. UW26]
MSRWTIEARRLQQHWRTRWAAPRRLFLRRNGVCDYGPAVASGLPVHYASFDAWCAAQPGCAAEVLVAGDLLHDLIVDASLPLTGEGEIATYARQLFTHYHGAAAQRWGIAPWQSGATRGACALHGVEAAVLQAQAAAHGVYLRALRPWWSVALAQVARAEPVWAAAPHAALALVEGALVTWIEVDGGVCVAIRHLRLERADGDSLVEALAAVGAVERAVIVIGYGGEGSGVEATGVCCMGALEGVDVDARWVGGDDDSTATTAWPCPDLLPQAVRPPALAWALAATGVLVLAAAVGGAFASRQALLGEEARLQRLAALTLPSGVTAALAGARSDSRGVEAARIAREIAALLRHPWPDLLVAVENAGGDDVHWLALEHSAAQPEIRLEGVAPDLAAALRVVATLAHEEGWNDVTLRRTQVASGAGLRFELTARIGAPSGGSSNAAPGAQFPTAGARP